MAQVACSCAASWNTWLRPCPPEDSMRASWQCTRPSSVDTRNWVGVCGSQAAHSTSAVVAMDT
eukprot:252624-Prorocentrum_minimum.AAC.1